MTNQDKTTREKPIYIYKDKCFLCNKPSKFMTWCYYCKFHKTHHLAEWCSEECLKLTANCKKGKHHNHTKNYCCGEYRCDIKTRKKEVKK